LSEDRNIRSLSFLKKDMGRCLWLFVIT
jgi:hypothetical protein